MNNLNIETLGQVFTPENIVKKMYSLIKNKGNILEPSAGNGAFFDNLPEPKIGIEFDKNIIKNNKILNLDFFEFDEKYKFDTIIGNPPYVRAQDIHIKTKNFLKKYKNIFDNRSNLYLFFIYKSILHLNNGGELIFITPRDFIKNTSSIKLNNFIFSQGTITDFIDLGDQKIFKNVTPNCIIWRFEKGNFSKKTKFYDNYINNNYKIRDFLCFNGQLLFTKQHYFLPFYSLFFVKVGAVSGADKIFANEIYGDTDFVYSNTRKTGNTRKMIYNKNKIEAKNLYLQSFKEQLLKRQIRKFNENSWWLWGRDYFKSDLPRIYVNTKTRINNPFFINECLAYDGSILAIFPKFNISSKELKLLCDLLNSTDWNELGFVCNGRFLFSQKSLENCLLDDKFKWLFAKIQNKNLSLFNID